MKKSITVWLYSILWLGSGAEKLFEGGHLLSSTAFNQIIIQSRSIYAQQLCPQFVYNGSWSWNEKFIKKRMHLWRVCLCVCVFVCADVQYIYVCTAFKVDQPCSQTVCMSVGERKRQWESVWEHDAQGTSILFINCMGVSSFAGKDLYICVCACVCACVWERERKTVYWSDRVSKLSPAAVFPSCLDLTWCQYSEAECGQLTLERLQFLVCCLVLLAVWPLWPWSRH